MANRDPAFFLSLTWLIYLIATVAGAVLAQRESVFGLFDRDYIVITIIGAPIAAAVLGLFAASRAGSLGIWHILGYLAGLGLVWFAHVSYVATLSGSV